jgi:putative PIN family toxin of toxin-antitoxin system
MGTKMMRIILDTNVIVSALSSRSAFHWIIEALLDEQFEMAVSNEVLTEYEEILTQKYDKTTTDNFLRALQELPNVRFVQIYFRWNFLNDTDDDKFVDAYIVDRSHYLVTEDKGFGVLKKIPFPRVRVINIAYFKKLLEKSQNR